MHSLLSAAGLFFFFFTPLSSFTFLCQYSSTLQSSVQRALRVQSAGRAVGGQVRTEKGERKRSVTKAQSDGSQLSCGLSVVLDFYSATIHTSGDHSSFHRPRSSLPHQGAEAGEGEGGRDAAPACQHHFQDQKDKNPEQSFPSATFPLKTEHL